MLNPGESENTSNADLSTFKEYHDARGPVRRLAGVFFQATV